jgi:GAF domain-containing protein
VSSALYLPLLREGECIGLLAFAGKRANMFGPSEIAQAESFRDQALIAMVNARLFRETQEALQQQTATADVLKVISRATFDLPSVLDTLMETAARLCDIDSGGLTIRDGEVFRYAAFRGISDEFKAVLLARPIIPSRDTIAGRVALEGKVVQVEDLAADPDYKLPESIKLGSIRTSLGVPLLRKGAVVGTITVNRQRVAPFTERQIELLRTFADQAVIAIENARLLEAEQQRSRELAEALQQQTATADVLKVISRSAFDLQPVLETLISSAVELSGAFSGAICVRDGDVFRYRAGTGPGYSPDLQRFLE